MADGCLNDGECLFLGDKNSTSVSLSDIVLSSCTLLGRNQIARKFGIIKKGAAVVT